MNYYNLEHAPQIAAALAAGGTTAVQAASRIASVAARVGLLEGHLQCRNFSSAPEASEAIREELAQAQKFLHAVWEGETK